MEMAAVLKLLEVIGFPLWAVVIVLFGFLLRKDVTSLNKSLQQYILKTETRIVKLETLLERVEARIDK